MHAQPLLQQAVTSSGEAKFTGVVAAWVGFVRQCFDLGLSSRGFFTLQCSWLNVCQSVSAKCRVGVVARGGRRSPRCAYQRRGAIFVNCLSSWWALAFHRKGLCAHEAVSERQASRAANAHGGLSVCTSFLPAFYGRGHMDLFSAPQIVALGATRWA